MWVILQLKLQNDDIDDSLFVILSHLSQATYLTTQDFRAHGDSLNGLTGALKASQWTAFCHCRPTTKWSQSLFKFVFGYSHDLRERFWTQTIEVNHTSTKTMVLYMSFDKFLLAVESRDLSQADKSIIRMSSFPNWVIDSRTSFSFSQQLRPAKWMLSILSDFPLSM